MLGTGDVGHRVVVRHRTPHGATDVLGELASLDDEQLVVRAESGREHRIARPDVIAGKPVGPRPARYSEIIALERIADEAWPAPVVERFGQWRLRYADGWTNRANSALPLGTVPGSLDEAVQACRDFYARRGVPAKITVPLPARRDVARHLDAGGWVPQPPVLVQTAPLAAILGAEPRVEPPAEPRVEPPAEPRVELHAEPSPEFLALVAARKAGLPESARHVLTAVPAVRFAHVVDSSLVAAARGTVVGPSAGPWLHLGLVEVVPAARRRGLARAVSSALAAWAQGLGATRAVLQVEQHNDAAVRLYRTLGFTTHHTYVTYLAG